MMANLNHIQSWVGSMKKDPTWTTLSQIAGSAASGAFFGSALTAAGVHSPEVIINQFRLLDFHMFHVFTVALGSSVFIILALDRMNIVQRQIRPPTSLGLLSTQYDGNIIGGALVGIGMSMSGSCPGTVAAQLAQGVRTAGVTAFGGVVGAMAHIWLTRPVRRTTPRHATRPVSPRPAKNQLSITDATGLGEPTLYALFATISASLIYVSAATTQPFWQSHGAGGLYLGTAQLASLLLTSSTLGSSGIYDQAARLIWNGLGVKEISLPPMPPKSLLFAVGAVLGSSLLTLALPTHLPAVESPFVSIPSAFVGGTFMALGAKIAKGCTSGHGLSGLGALSASSLVSVASMFGAGIAYQFIS